MLRASPSSYTLFFPYLNIYYLLKPMQIYGILLNIRGKTENFMEFCGIFKPKMLNLIRYNKKVIFLFGRT